MLKTKSGGQMAVLKEEKAQVVKKFQHGAGDTGSTEVQVALITTRIRNLTDHFKKHAKDHHGRMGLIKLVSQRKSLLNYLRRKNPEGYTKLISDLELRK
jgi:small subunit ribosomal protein S15